MNKPQAHDVLDLARAGGPVTEQEITEALWLTGDLSERPAIPLQIVASFAWPHYTMERGTV